MLNLVRATSADPLNQCLEIRIIPVGAVQHTKACAWETQFSNCNKEDMNNNSDIVSQAMQMSNISSDIVMDFRLDCW